jgi:type II secretory pathway component PulF
VAEFQYTAMDQKGAVRSGHIAMPTRSQAIAALAQQGRFVTQIGEHAQQSGAQQPPGALRLAGWSGKRRLPLRLKSSMFAQLSTALSAGLALLPALRIIEEQATQPALRQLTGELANAVQGGESLSEAFAHQPRVFAPLEISMIRVGETAGVLDQVMGSLADFAERDLEFREKIRSAATYPLFVLGLAGVSVLIILLFILPRILATVGDTAALLPWPTRVLMAISNLARAWGWLGALLCVGGWRLFSRWRATPAGGIAWDRFLLRLPLVGTALRRSAVARFARTLGTLTRAGIDIIEAMRVMRDTLGNRALAAKIDRIAASITQGQSIAEPLRQSGEFPPLLIQVIALGERTGRLDELLLKVADAYEKETAAAVQRVMSILPAVLIVCLALIVAFILAAVLLPIVSMELTPLGG